MSRPSSLTWDEITLIKEALAEGQTHRSVADNFDTTRTIIANIAQGRTGAQVPWPDGSTGRMPNIYRRKYHQHVARKRIEDGFLPTTVQMIKRLIWDGVPSGPLADAFGTTRETIRLLKIGNIHSRIPWPLECQTLTSTQFKQAYMEKRYAFVRRAWMAYIKSVQDEEA